MLSAQLDGEDDPAGRPALDAHLAECPGCRGWLDQAATVNRLTRIGVPGGPDLSAKILAALPEPAPRTRRRPSLPAMLYLALGLVGAVQLILGLSQIGGGVASDHVHSGVDATPGHLWHESAAWNVALGAGYLFIALRRGKPAGLVPMLTAFVGMLLLLSVNDLTGGRVDSTRLISHCFVILGYLLIVGLSRMPDRLATPPGARARGGSGWRARFADDPSDDAAPPAFRPGLRLVPRGPMTAEHDKRHAA